MAFQTVIKTALALSLLAAGPAAAETYKFMTGPQGGSWYPLGGAIANFVRGVDADVRLRVQPGGGISNVMAVESGKAQVGLGNVTSTMDAIAGNAPFRGQAQNIRNLAVLYPQFFQFVVARDGDVGSIADMAGRAIAVGPRGHSGEQASRQSLEIFGLTYDDLSNVNHVGYVDAVALFKDGHVDAYTVFTTVPAGAVMDAASARDVRVLSYDDKALAALQVFNPQYVRHEIAAGTYPAQDKPVTTFGTWTQVIVNAALPDDAAYAIVKALAENLEGIAAVVSAMDGATVEMLATPVGMPLHPGAQRFYHEAGVLD
jgi:TRAP transporter TAXI family solute receptor